MFVYVKGLGVTSSDQDIREHVGGRYAAAALSVVSGSGASCCGPLRPTGVMHAQEQHRGFAVITQALDLGQRPQLLTGEPFGHQRQELDHGGPEGELVERGMQEPFDRLGAEDTLELGGQSSRRGPQRE